MQLLAHRCCSNKVVRVVTDRIKNPNGCNVPATWFVLQNGTNCALAQQLLADNHGAMLL